MGKSGRCRGLHHLPCPLQHSELPEDSTVLILLSLIALPSASTVKSLGITEMPLEGGVTSEGPDNQGSLSFSVPDTRTKRKERMGLGVVRQCWGGPEA